MHANTYAILILIPMNACIHACMYACILSICIPMHMERMQEVKMDHVYTNT